MLAMLRHLLRTVNLFDTAKSVLFLCFLAACHGQSPSGYQVQGLVYYETYDPRSLDPALSTDVPTGEMVTLMFDGLTQFDADGKLLPALSDRWTSDRTGQRYVFHLRPGVVFHDGRARDVRGIEVLGDTAVAFTLTEPLAVFPKFLAMPVTSIAPSPVPDGFAQRPIGTGPWRFVAWEHDDYLRFERNPKYWGGAPESDTLTVRIIPEAFTRAAELLAGRLSVAEIPFGETAKWEQEHRDWLKRKPALRAVYVPLNNRRGPLRDPRVRQALNHAVNVPEMLRTVWNGRGVAAAGSIPPALGGSDASRHPYSYDTTEARRLLREAGYPDGFAVQLWRSGTNVELGRVAQALQAQLAAVGIRVEIVSRDASSMREAVRKGETDMAIRDWWADYPDADNFLYPLFARSSFGPGGNYSFYSDPVADSLMLVARRTVDQPAREALYQRIDNRVFEAAPWIYLWFAVDLWAQHPGVDGWDVPVIFNGQRWTQVRVAAGR